MKPKRRPLSWMVEDGSSVSMGVRAPASNPALPASASAEAEAEAAEAAKAAPEAKVVTTEIGPEAAVPVVAETKAVSSPNPIKGDVQISQTQAMPQTTARLQHTSTSGEFLSARQLCILKLMVSKRHLKVVNSLDLLAGNTQWFTICLLKQKRSMQ